MQYLLDYAAERVTPLSEAALTIQGVQGILVEPDPIWLGWLALTDYAGRDRANALTKGLLEPLFRGVAPQSSEEIRRRLAQTFIDARDLVPARPLSLDDLKDLPPGWEEYLRRGQWPEQAGDPIVVKVRLLPGMLGRNRSRLRELPLLNRLRVVFETHPPAVFQAGPRSPTSPLVGGVSIGVSSITDGTLGGMVTDGKTFYAITCSHVVPNNKDVVEQPAQTDSGSVVRIGKRVNGTTLVSSGASDPCNAYTTTTPINTLDAALVEIDASVSVKSPLEIRKIGAVTNIIPKHLLNRGQQAEFSGKQSGHKSRLLQAVGVPYQMTDATTGNSHCFQHLLVFRSASGSKPSKRGDSGAWLCMQYGNGKGWAGMIIGGDGIDGYAVFAEDLEQWWKGQGFTLAL